MKRWGWRSTGGNTLAGFFLRRAHAAEKTGFSAVGVYSVIAYSTARRTHEIGIRMTLGAQPQNILHLIVGQGGRMALVGIVLGLGASLR